MPFIYVLGGLLLGYCIITIVAYIRFHWCKCCRLSDTLEGHMGEQFNLMQADAYFQRGRFFHEKGLFETAVTAYENCFKINESHPLSLAYHKFALARQANISLNGEENDFTQDVDSEEFSPLRSVIEPDEPHQNFPNELQQTTFNEINFSMPDEEITIDLSPEDDLPPPPPPTKPRPLVTEEDKSILEFYANGQNLSGQTQSGQKMWGEAVVEYTKALESDPHMAKACLGRASALLKDGRIDEAIADYSTLIQLDPQNAILRYKRGNAFLHKNLLDEAIDDYSAALTISPDYPESLNRRGTAYFRKQLFDLAGADFTRAIILNPNFAEAYSNRGIVRNQMGMKDQAQQDFIRAESIKQRNHPTEEVTSNEELVEDIKSIFDQAMLDLENNDHSKALVNFNRVITAAPDNPTAYFQRACIHLDHRRLENAIRDFSSAIECNQEFGEAYSKRGQANILSNLYIDAINDFDKAIELLPNHVDSYLNRGRANSQRGQREEAIADFSKATEIDPKNDAAFYNRGLEWQNLGATDKAMTDLNIACELGNNAACIAYINLQTSA